MPAKRLRWSADPRIMADAAAAVSTVARAGAMGRTLLWRFELALITAPPLAALGIGAALGLDWLTAPAATGLVVFGIAMAWPPSRQRLIARSSYLTPHRVGADGTNTWIQTRHGRLPAVVYTVPDDFGERVWLWCRAAITAGDLEAARDFLRAASWARDVRVLLNDRRNHIVVLEAIRCGPAERPRPARAW